jgi:hypothetical protein
MPANSLSLRSMRPWESPPPMGLRGERIPTVAWTIEFGQGRCQWLTERQPDSTVSNSVGPGGDKKSGQ